MQHLIEMDQGWWVVLGCVTLFFFTFVIANSIFMAVTYGTEYCFFSRTGATSLKMDVTRAA